MKTVVLSMTDVPAFVRLVQFLQDVDDYAHREVDLDVKDLVEVCREDLARLKRRGGGS